MKLVELHRNYIIESTRSVIDHSLPVKPVQASDTPIIAIEKWKLDDDGKLHKKYIFESVEDRNKFVTSLLNYELDKGHYAEFSVTAREVSLRLITHDTDRVTELDKNYAKYADVVRKDISYGKIRGHV